jgi:hypothetical protein
VGSTLVAQKSRRDIGHESIANRAYRAKYLKRSRQWDDDAFAAHLHGEKRTRVMLDATRTPSWEEPGMTPTKSSRCAFVLCSQPVPLTMLMAPLALRVHMVFEAAGATQRGWQGGRGGGVKRLKLRIEVGDPTAVLITRLHPPSPSIYRYHCIHV